MRFNIGLVFAALSISALATNVFAAAAMSADYHDHFHPASGVSSDIHLISLTNNDQFIQVTRDDANSFTISDTPTHWVNPGITSVTYGTYDGKRSCTLTIQDGAYMSDPMVQGVTCTNLSYRGMYYDGFGTYQYSLVFSYN